MPNVFHRLGEIVSLLPIIGSGRARNSGTVANDEMLPTSAPPSRHHAPCVDVPNNSSLTPMIGDRRLAKPGGERLPSTTAPSGCPSQTGIHVDASAVLPPLMPMVGTGNRGATRPVDAAAALASTWRDGIVLKSINAATTSGTPSYPAPMIGARSQPGYIGRAELLSSVSPIFNPLANVRSEKLTLADIVQEAVKSQTARTGKSIVEMLPIYSARIRSQDPAKLGTRRGKDYAFAFAAKFVEWCLPLATDLGERPATLSYLPLGFSPKK